MCFRAGSAGTLNSDINLVIKEAALRLPHVFQHGLTGCLAVLDTQTAKANEAVL